MPNEFKVQNIANLFENITCKNPSTATLTWKNLIASAEKNQSSRLV